MDIEKINTERIASWKAKLIEQQSTPVLLVGVGHNEKKGQLTFCVTEDMTNLQILALLKGAVSMLEQGIAKQN